MSPTISIAMAVYNGERFLKEQLQSLSNQTTLPFELIACDDGSTDNSVNILEDFAKTAPFPVRVIRNEKNLYYADNFMKAASLCQGECIAFCDQDDIWDSSKLSVAAAALENREVTLFSHGCQIVSAEGKPLKDAESVLTTGHYTLSDLDPLNAFFGYSCVFRRHILSLCPAEKRPIDLIHNNILLAHDRWIYFLATAAGIVSYDARPLVFYRQHENNCIGTETFRKRSISKIFHDVRNKYNTYIEKRNLISSGFLSISSDIAKKQEAYNPSDLIDIYSDMNNFYSKRAFLFKTNPIKSLIHIMTNKLQGLYNKPRRYSNSRAFLEDLVAIFLAKRVIAPLKKSGISG